MLTICCVIQPTLDIAWYLDKEYKIFEMKVDILSILIDISASQQSELLIAKSFCHFSLLKIGLL